MISAALAGLGLGLAVGGSTHALVIMARDKRDSIFHGVWAAGFLVRLTFGAAFAWFLIRKPYVSFVPAMLGLLFGQMAAQMVPLGAGSRTER